MIESIPNCSEGRRAEVVEALADAVRHTAGTMLLDHTADPSHNRSVFTLAGSPAAVVDALVRLVEVAVSRIDLRTQRGVHPRIGAVDVVPFVPLGPATLGECVDLSHLFAALVAGRFGIPVYLYEASARAPHRRRLEDIRRGEYEALAAKMRTDEWAPDYGPSAPHPTAGAIVTGARRPLIAFNMNLTTDRVEIARAIAAAVRERGGGLPGIKALGLFLAHQGFAQVSTNITDYTRTSLQTLYDTVAAEARRRGVDILESELIGLVPAAALAGTSVEHLKLTGFTPDRLLENRIGAAQAAALARGAR